MFLSKKRALCNKRAQTRVPNGVNSAGVFYTKGRDMKENSRATANVKPQDLLTLDVAVKPKGAL
jgi:hypothetical protein